MERKLKTISKKSKIRIESEEEDEDEAFVILERSGILGEFPLPLYIPAIEEFFGITFEGLKTRRGLSIHCDQDKEGKSYEVRGKPSSKDSTFFYIS